MRQFLHPVIKTDQWAQYVDDIGIAAKFPEHLTTNLQAVFNCIQKIKTFPGKMSIWNKRSWFFWTNLYNKRRGPTQTKDHKKFGKVKFYRSKKALQRYYGFLSYYRNYISRLAEKKLFLPFPKNKEKKDKIIITTTEFMKEFCGINDVLYKCCQLALRQSLPDRQLVLMTDASLQAAGYAVLTEDDAKQFIMSTRKTYVLVAYGSKTFTPSQMKMSINERELLALY